MNKLLNTFTLILLMGCSDSYDTELISERSNGIVGPSDSTIVQMLPQTHAIDLSQEQRAFVDKSNDFSFNLYRTIHATENKKSDISSPLSVIYVLGMLNNGATGTTATEISHILGNENRSKQMINDYCKALIEQAPVTDPSVILKIANIVAVDKNSVLEKDYQKDLKDYYSADVVSLDFSKNSSIDYLNKWCNEKTEGLIPKIIDTLSPEELLVLMNAVYFKATWTKKFDPKDTQDETFRKEDGINIKLPMMHRKAQIRYSQNDIYYGILLPFGSGDNWSMKILLPKNGKTIDDIIKTLNNRSWNENFKDEAIVDIKIPRFKIESDITLNDIVTKMGAPSIFNPLTANFSSICKGQKLFYVSQMKQKAAIEVDEEGTKTTAVTAVCMEGENHIDNKIDFHANRPFVYIIQEASSGAIFFIGTFRG